MKSRIFLILNAFIILTISVTTAQTNFWEKIGIDASAKANALYITGQGAIYVGSGATTDGGAMFLSTNDGDNWTSPYNAGGPGVSSVHVINTNTILIGTGSGLTGVIKQTTDAGNNWTSVYTFGLTEVVTSFTSTSAGIFASSGVYSGSTGKIIFSNDNGTNWTLLTSSLGAVMSIAANSDGDLYAGNHNGDIFKSVDDGANWTQIRTGSNRDIGSIAIDAGGTIYIGVENEGVYYSDDDGNIWTQINNGLGNKQVTALLLVNDTLFFAGTPQDGVFRTTNSGNNWSDVTRGLGWHNVGAGALKIYNGYLYCGVGDGVYKSMREATDIPAPPSPPENLTATDGARIVTLNWTVSDSAGANVVYKLYRRTSETGFVLRRDSINSTSTQYVDSVRNDVQYFYYMTSFDYNKSLESDSTDHIDGMSTLHDPVPPDAPTNLRSTSGNTFVRLTWNAVQASPVHYSVFRSNISNQYGTAIATSLTSTTYLDNSVTNDTRYYYIVKAVNDTSNLSSRESNEVSETPRKPDPAPPTNAQLAVQDPNIMVWWQASISQDVTEYRVLRSRTEGVAYTQIGTTTPPSVTYTDNQVGRDTTYYYIVKAWDGVHESQQTEEVSGMLETLGLTLQVLPTSKYTVDRFDNVVYEILVKDQAGNPIQCDITIDNGVINDVVITATDAAGYYNYSFQIPGDQVFSEYTMTFTANKTAYVSDNTTRPIEVVAIPRATNDWAIVYSQEGTPKLIFAMVDTNNKWFSPGDPGKVTNQGHDVAINKFLLFQGDMTIDTVSESITSNGKWFVKSPVSPPKEYVLLNGDLYVQGYQNGEILFNSNDANLENASLLSGLKLYLGTLTFIGGLYSSGISLDGYFKLPGIQPGCAADEYPSDDIYFQALVFDESGVNTAQFSVPSFSPDPTACFSNLIFRYDNSSDLMTIIGDFSIPWLTLKGIGTIQSGEMQSIDLYTFQGESANIGETGMTIRGVTGQVTGITQPPMDMTLNGTITSASPDFFELDMTGDVELPQKIDYSASEARIILEPTFNNWQIVGPMTGKINITSHLDMDGDMKAGTLDGNQYVVEGSGNLKYQWKPDERLRGGIKGDVIISDFPNEFPYDLIQMLWEQNFPIRIREANVFVHDRKVMGNLHFGGYIGTLNFTLDLDKVYGDEGFLTVGSGALNLNGIIRKGGEKGEEIQNFDSHKFEGQSMPIMLMKKDKTQAITKNDTLNLTGGMDKVFIRIMSDTQVPGSYLLDPKGGRHNAEDDPPKDSNVVFKKSANGKKGYWVLKDNFETGNWIAGTDPDETHTSDYRDVFATFDVRDIQLTITKDQNAIKAEWNNTGVPQGPYLEFYLGVDTNDVNGLMIGSSQENSGEFNYTLDDTLPECLYYLYVLRYEDEKVDRYYSTEPLWNNKGNLMPPAVLSSVYFGGSKKLVIGWNDPNTIENIQGYLIRLEYTDGSQEIISRPYAGTNNIEIDIDIDYVSNPNLEIAIAAYTTEGFQSCWSVEQGVTVDVEDYPLSGFENADDRMSIFPNPLSEMTNIRFKVKDNSNIKISVYDLLGYEINILANDYYIRGIYDVKFKPETIANGTYYVKYQSDDLTFTKLMVIAK